MIKTHIVICFLCFYSFAQAKPLSIGEAEHLALNLSPEIQQLKAKAGGLHQQSIAEGQLSDPQLTAGVINVPTNSFSFTQDEMTMLAIGVQQQFPRGHSLAIKSKQTKALATAEHRKVREQISLLLRNVRETWLDLYYWNEALAIIHDNQKIYRRLLKVSESQYGVGKTNQSDVLQVQVELSRLSNQELQIEQRIDVLRAQLGRFIGQQEAQRNLSENLPFWLKPPSRLILQQRLTKHPLIQIDSATIEAARQEVALAKEQYKPGWLLGASYGFRQGQMPNGMPRSDMLTAQVTVDLPLFPGKRQDKQFQASVYRLQASHLDRAIHYRDLLKELQGQYAIWEKLSQRERIYQQQILPEAKQNAKASLLAYQNATVEMNTVLRAYSNELDIRQEQLQVLIEKMKARVALLYLEGVTI
ncbi:Outer membrane efflux protein [Legionella wadsworthii]|uniref:Outer membrane efflux protein n=1 Tax=Legionella wadsworthii TaxID=28088 RepID=A0A378P408_9GAMM|nr:TolC family protein [Legionella wadsworthii]STY78841.1 Outer membrane efflux protein [Legionella wadsworthii]